MQLLYSLFRTGHKTGKILSKISTVIQKPGRVFSAEKLRVRLGLNETRKRPFRVNFALNMKSGSARGLNFLLKQLFAAAGNEQLRTKKRRFGMLKEVLRNYLKFCSFSSSEKSTFNRVILKFH